MIDKRIRWFMEDKRSELEQITFGDEIQHYITPDTVDGIDVMSVLCYINVEDMTPRQADDLSAMVADGFTPPGKTVSAYVPHLKKVVSHQYAENREAILHSVDAIESRLLDAKALVKSPPNN